MYGTRADDQTRGVDGVLNDGGSADIVDAPLTSARSPQGAEATARMHSNDQNAAPVSHRMSSSSPAVKGPGGSADRSVAHGRLAHRVEGVASGGQGPSHLYDRSGMHSEHDVLTSVGSSHLAKTPKLTSESPDCRVNLCSRTDFMYNVHDEDETSDENASGHRDAEPAPPSRITSTTPVQSARVEASANSENDVFGSFRRSYGRQSPKVVSDAAAHVRASPSSSSAPASNQRTSARTGGPKDGPPGSGRELTCRNRKDSEEGRDEASKLTSISPATKNQIRTRNQKQTHKTSPSALVARPQPFVLVCGRTAERQEQVSIVRRLGGKSAYSHHFDPDTTHVLCTELRRTEKFLCACAKGIWIL